MEILNKILYLLVVQIMTALSPNSPSLNAAEGGGSQGYENYFDLNNLKYENYHSSNIDYLSDSSSTQHLQKIAYK